MIERSSRYKAYAERLTNLLEVFNPSINLSYLNGFVITVSFYRDSWDLTQVKDKFLIRGLEDILLPDLDSCGSYLRSEMLKLIDNNKMRKNLLVNEMLPLEYNHLSWMVLYIVNQQTDLYISS